MHDASDAARTTPLLQGQHLLLFLLSIVTTLLLGLGSLGLLPPDTAGTPSTEGRREREIDVLLGVEADDEGWDVDDLLADAVG